MTLKRENTKTMKTTAKRAVALIAGLILGTACTMQAMPSVSNVNMVQIPDTRLVEITYDLGVEDAIVTLAIETNNVALPDSVVTWLSGDVCKVVKPGSRSIMWNAGLDWPENVAETAKARVTAWCTNAPPQVMVINLNGGPSTNAYPVCYYTSVEALPYGGLTNLLYKSAYLVMRKISKGAFSMGDGQTPVPVTLTQDFYTGVFPVTQKQWYNVMGDTQHAKFNDTLSQAFRPMERVSYDLIRGTLAQGGAGWPANNTVYTESFIGRIRTKVGLAEFDLPTEAQWECACRAGTYTCFNDGNASANTSGDNGETNAWLDVLGRYKFNGGYMNNGVTEPASDCSPENGTAIVGSYPPNAWGLYDMHGNVYEWCLDWYATALVGGNDPKGPGQGEEAYPGPTRVARGGSWSHSAYTCGSAYRSRYYGGAWFLDGFFGFRLVRTLP